MPSIEFATTLLSKIEISKEYMTCKISKISEKSSIIYEKNSLLVLTNLEIKSYLREFKDGRYTKTQIKDHTGF